MKTIDTIIIHCSATRAGQDLRAKDIDRMHRARGFNQIGYNFVIDLDGMIENGRPLSIDGAHCNTKGFSESSYNKHSIGICYIGGLNASGKPADTRTPAQRATLRELVTKLCKEYPIIEVLGHRDTSPDLDGSGEIEPAEYIKACPCFDVKEFLRSGRELLFVLLVALVVPVLLSGCRSKKEVINRESEVRVDSSLNSSSGKSLVKNKVALEKDSEVVEEHIDQVLFVFPVDTLGLKAGMVVKTVVDRKNVNEKQLLQEVNSQSVSLSDMSAKTEIHKTGVEKTTNRTTGSGYWYGIILLVLVLVCWICKVKRK